ncbi:MULTISPECIES: 2-oxoglutarate dehydrogenase complex dihydrolipoyllysine-residue succinyltransferase [Neobacillus]|uniref:Dihydrolipoyllysine-residue succinyltransferase component of 2-oxoglutarate dehydrogenase complex n=1 Tax=Neobacillus rhizophilus TaxID=2833579 RepID=A0A942UAS5_9BACI|nr:MULTISPECIES: 2-oxoglutarate dehydrogenase complex dihydrolipoyllysine-residue succinyltransferase [Neobacillus]MBS4216037.1 2-oxoglutarate dehydrogenase complex dihydrolipoyllysine-residue succinyltransferase [Neobacillus rhizophilus]MBU8919969.1 2-oxoglutarate dehydrogenase complex dihydrolipoyllysine-residue succinyltransferase [Bacillus sp. FJAT-29953]
MAEIKVPELAESITEGTIAKWLKNTGEHVEKGEYLVELETDKVNIEIISDFSGTLTDQKFSEGDTVRVGETIAVVEEGVGQAAPAAVSEPAPQLQTVVPTEVPPAPPNNTGPVERSGIQQDRKEESGKRPIASPAARKLAREKGINLQEIPSSDPLGRLRKQDVSLFQSGMNPAGPSAPKRETSVEPMKVENPAKPVINERMSRRRQTIAKRLLEVKQSTAMLTTFNEIDMTAVMDLRKRRKDKFFEEHDVRLGFMSFFTKAVVAALKKYPYLNAEIQGDQILVKKFYDIGIAVAAEEGLVVPVVRDADRKSFAEIESDIMQLAEKARANKLSLKDLQGGTFTITNGGVFGSLLSTPILNGPQVGILGMHTIQLRPVAVDKDKMENRPMMYVALSYDHRIVDGKEAVSFLSTIKKLLEDPETLLLEG